MDFSFFIWLYILSDIPFYFYCFFNILYFITFTIKHSLIEHHAHITLIVLDVKIQPPILHIATGARHVRPNGFH